MKLVRDKIPEIIEGAGETNYYKISKCKTNDEFFVFLKEKLLEETKELFNEPSSLTEMADVLEVLCCIAKQYGYSLEDVEAARKEKYEARGGFEIGYLLELIAHDS